MNQLCVRVVQEPGDIGRRNSGGKDDCFDLPGEQGVGSAGPAKRNHCRIVPVFGVFALQLHGEVARARAFRPDCHAPARQLLEGERLL